MRRGAHATISRANKTNAPTRRSLGRRTSSRCARACRLKSQTYSTGTYRKRLLYSICYSAGRWVRSHFWRAILRAAKRREPTNNNTVRAPLKNLWCSLAPLSHCRNSYLAIQRRFHRQLAGLPKVFDSTHTTLSLCQT